MGSLDESICQSEIFRSQKKKVMCKDVQPSTPSPEQVASSPNVSPADV